MRISLQDASTQPAESYLYRVEQSGINQRLVEGIKRSPDSRQCRKGGCRGMSTLLTIANKKRQNIARIASDPWKKLFENLAISTQHSALHGTTTPDLDRSAPDYLTQQVKSALAGGPILPVAHDDNLLRGDLCAARHQRVATLCRSSQPWVTLGDLGWKWVNIGGRGRGQAKKP
jgi:hypothetical protein